MSADPLCSHCGEFGVVGHTTPRLRLRRVGSLELDESSRWCRAEDLLLHDRCWSEWLTLHPASALISEDADDSLPHEDPG